MQGLLQLTFSGFDYPHNVFSRFQPASRYFRLERSWDSPFRVLIPTKILCPFRGQLLSYRYRSWLNSVEFKPLDSVSEFFSLCGALSRGHRS